MNDENMPRIISIKREGIKKGVYILPNLCTTASLFCGFFSVISSLQGEFVHAAWAIVIAGIFDFLDGRVARLTRTESEFGIEYDSLVDLASFGLAPAVLMFTWGLNGFHRIGWLAAFLFFACGALRLARFNVQANSVERNWFQGLPIPAAAGVCSTMVIFYDYVGSATLQGSYLVLITTVLLSLLMVSTIQYRSFKQVHFKKKWSFFWLVLLVGMMFVIAVEPRVTIFSLAVAYVLWGVAEELITLRKSREIIEKIRARRNVDADEVEGAEIGTSETEDVEEAI